MTEQSTAVTGCGKRVHVMGTNGGMLYCGASLQTVNGTATTYLCGTCKHPILSTPVLASDPAPTGQEPGGSGGGGGSLSLSASHCPDLAACDDNTCSACGPTMKDLGESSFSKLHDDPIAFLRQFDSRDAHDREAVIVAIAAWGGEAVDYVGSFIAETRNRAMILEMLS